MLKFRSFALLAGAVALAGCATGPHKPAKPKPAPVMFKQAHQTLESENYRLAIKQFQNLEATYPFGDYAIQSELNLIFAQYMSGDNDSALDEAQRFVREHPRSQYVAYAMYMEGVAQFPSGLNPLWKPFPGTNAVGFDPAHVRKSFQAFHDLVARFPKSRYAPDARQRMVYLRDRLAKYDMHVAAYYMRRGAWLAAARRAKDVVKRFPETSSVGPALNVMVKSYHNLGLDELAGDAKRVLDANAGHYGGKD
jgi:outer membrane protein assembly factor BamD